MAYEAVGCTGAQWAAIPSDWVDGRSEMKVNGLTLATSPSGSNDVLGSSQRSPGSGRAQRVEKKEEETHVTVTVCRPKLASALGARAVCFLSTELFPLPPSDSSTVPTRKDAE